MRWDRLTFGIGLSYALLAWSLGYGAVLPELRDELHMSASVAAVHGSLFGVCLLVFAAFGSRFFAAVANRTVFALGVAGMLGGGILFGLGRSVTLTLGGAGIAGAGAALLVIVVPSVVFLHQPDASTQAMSTLNAFPMASATLLPIAVGAALAGSITWRFAYLAPLLAIAIGVALATGRSPVPDGDVATPMALSELFRIPQFTKRWFALVCGVFVEIGTGIWAASIMRNEGGASKGLAATLTVGFFVGMAIGRVAISNLLRRFDGGAILMASFIASAVALAPFLLGPGLPVRVFGLTLLGLALSPVYPLSIARMFALHHDTATLGRAAALASGVGVTAGPLLLGALSDHVGLRWATAVLPAFLLVGLLTISARRVSSIA